MLSVSLLLFLAFSLSLMLSQTCFLFLISCLLIRSLSCLSLSPVPITAPLPLRETSKTWLHPALGKEGISQRAKWPSLSSGACHSLPHLRFLTLLPHSACGPWMNQVRWQPCLHSGCPLFTWVPGLSSSLSPGTSLPPKGLSHPSSLHCW